MYSKSPTNHVKKDKASPICDRVARVKDVNIVSSKPCTPAQRPSKLSTIKIILENRPPVVTKAGCSGTNVTAKSQDHIPPTTATFPVGVTRSHPVTTFDSDATAKTVSPLRMPIPTYCIPNFQPAASRYGHSAYSPYRQRVVIRPLNGDPGCMFRYVPTFNTFPTSMSSTGTTDCTRNSSATSALATSDVITHQNGSAG